jgi:hypothetical protein
VGYLIGKVICMERLAGANIIFRCSPTVKEPELDQLEPTPRLE